MSEERVLWDMTKPCSEGEFRGHYHRVDGQNVWCPGGAEVRLERVGANVDWGHMEVLWREVGDE